jgi:protein gp37
MRVVTGIGRRTIKWDPWFGCFKVSEACKNCYIRQINRFEDKFYELNTSNIPEDTIVGVGLHTDFFLAEADHLRPAAWKIMKDNPQLIFEIYTKRVERIQTCLPVDWGEGYDNVIFCVTVENQKRADERIPTLLALKCKHKWLNCAPLLENIDLMPYLCNGEIECVTTSGERAINGESRELHLAWLESLSAQCHLNNIHFEIMFLGSKFVDGNTLICDLSPCFRSPFANNLRLDNYSELIFK